MNLLIIFILLFQFPLNVKGDLSQTMEKNNSKNYSNTESPENQTIQTTTKCKNTPGSCLAADQNKIAGTKPDPESILKLDPKTLFIFLLGVICSTSIFSTVLCLVAICKRCNATDANTDKASLNLEAGKREHDKSMMQADEGQADEQDPLHLQTPAEISTITTAFYNGTEEKMKILGKEQTEDAGEVTEVDYATINYSLLLKKDDEDLKPQNVESDYSEIQLNELNKEEEAQTSGGVKQDEVTQGQEGGMES